MVRLMLIGCSSTKSHAYEEIPAIDRYQGPVYRVIKKARKDGYWPKDTQIFIVSAQYGLITEDTPIKFYDQKMTHKRAVELQSSIGDALDALLYENDYSNIFINLGEIYMQSIATSTEMRRAYARGILKKASGGIGIRLKQTKVWIMSQCTAEIREFWYSPINR